MNARNDTDGPNYEVSGDWAPPTGGLAAALSAAQGKFPQIRRDRTVTVRMKSGGQYTFSYAPLESIFRSTMQALTDSQIAVTQTVRLIDGAEWMQTTLMHGSETRDSLVRIICNEPGPQAYGSALTYARRYGVTLALGVSADDDDDANAAEGNQATITPKGAIHDPRGDLGKNVPTDKAVAVADRMREIMGQDKFEPEMAADAFAFHDDLQREEREADRDPNDLYVAAADLLQAKERAAWKKLVALHKRTHINGVTQ